MTQRKLDTHRVEEYVSLWQPRPPDRIIFLRTQQVGIAVDRTHRLDLQRMQNEKEIRVDVAEDCRQRNFAVEIGAIVTRAQTFPLSRIRCERERLLTPVLGDLERLSGKEPARPQVAL